jgi:hypothetical protein
MPGLKPCPEIQIQMLETHLHVFEEEMETGVYKLPT